jgi:GDP-4-dehydro-6-deoxy-D-mannose reductase
LTRTSTDCAAGEVKVLVTGADGFVGRYLVERLIREGHQVIAGCRPSGEPVRAWDASPGVQVVPLELTEPVSVREALGSSCEAVVHLAAIASVREARDDPGQAWVVNAAGTARLVEAAASRLKSEGVGPLILVVSSAEVYGAGPAFPRKESDPLVPQSSYAASKAAAELAALEVARRTGLRVVIARPFQHTGPGQASRFVVPAFVERLRAARVSGAFQVPVGNLEPVRDLLDVRDVIEAYLALLVRGQPGEVYNIARGEGMSLRDLFQRVAALIGIEAEAVPDPSLVRSDDIPHLVGNPDKLRQATGWAPRFSLDQTLRDVVDAAAH